MAHVYYTTKFATTSPQVTDTDKCATAAPPVTNISNYATTFRI